MSLLFIFPKIKHIFLNKSGSTRAHLFIRFYLLLPDLEEDDDFEEEDLDPPPEEEDFETCPEEELLALETEPDDLADDMLRGAVILFPLLFKLLKLLELFVFRFTAGPDVPL